MKQLLVACTLFGVVAIGLAFPGGFGQFVSRPICECDALEACVEQKKVTADACSNNPDCTAILDAASVSVSAVKQCFEQGKQMHEEFKQCMTTELGKHCDDGSGTITEAETGGFPGGRRGGHKGRRGHKGRGGHRGGHGGGRHGGLIPEPLMNYKKCVHQCVRGDQGGRVKRGAHHGAKGMHMGCMKELECRPVMHTREARQAAMEACKPVIDNSAKFTEMCECIKAAGFAEMDCSAIPTWRSRQQRQVADDSNSAEDDSESNEEDSDESFELY